MELDLPTVVERNIQHFTGRTWLLPRVLEWFEPPDERLFILTGEPGTGKSMIAAWLTGAGPMPADAEAQAKREQLRSHVKGVHFFVAASGSTDPKALAQNLARQLTLTVVGFGDALAANLADQVQISSTQEVGTVAAGGSVTGVYIERLDLSGLSEELSFHRVLREPPQELYSSGYAEPLLLLVDALDEALTYTGKTNIVQLLAKLGHLPPQVRILATLPLPKGLGGLYHDFLNRELGADEDRWYETFNPLLGLIAVAQGEGLSRTQIQSITGKDMEQPLRICKQYLDGDLPAGPFRTFHRSFADFLLAERRAANAKNHIATNGTSKTVYEQRVHPLAAGIHILKEDN